MKKITYFLAVACCSVLVACASGVNLNSPPLEDKPAIPVNADKTASATGSGSASSAGVITSNAATQTSNAVTQNKVAAVNSDAAAGAGPAPAQVAKVIYFDYDSALIRPEFAATLEAHARWLNANRTRRVSVEGHTDASGGREYNLALGQRRADAVSRALALLGVSEQQIESVSFGMEKPADLDNTEAAMAKNRRVEFFYR